MTYNHNSDVIMTSFIFEEGTGIARHHGSSILNLHKCIQFYLNPEEIEVIGMEKLIYIRMFMKRKNIFQELPFGPFKFMFLFPNQSLKSLDYTSIHIQLDIILLN